MENLKNIAPVEDFNWEAYENGEAVTGMSHEALEQAYDSTLNKVNDREVVDGTVIAMNKREVVVNIGYKSDTNGQRQLLLSIQIILPARCIQKKSYSRL